MGVAITISADDSLTGASYHALERGEPATGVREPHPTLQPSRDDFLQADLVEEEAELEDVVEGPTAVAEEDEGEPRRVAATGDARREERGGYRQQGGEEETDGQQRSRRRRRRRGRGGGPGGELAVPGAEQPSDEGLAIVAQIGGVPAPAGEGARPSEQRGGGRGRRSGRWARSTPLPQEYRDQGAFPLDEGAQEAAAFVSPAEAHVPAFEKPEALAPVAAEDVAPPAPPIETPKAEPAPPPPAPAETAPIVYEAAEPPPKPRPSTETIITEADPDRPKKGGWWQRAKATLGGNGGN